MTLLQHAMAAHGGSDLWNSLEAIDAEISADGFLFTAKRRPALRHVRMRAWTREPRFALYDHPVRGQVAELAGTQEVRISDGSGAVLHRRADARSAFRSFGHLFSWDDLDFIYFAGYATWNYLTAPFLLARPGFVITEQGPGPGPLASLQRLQATFPDDIPTHCRDQIFYFDDQYLLRRLDYTAEVVGGWAHAAHLCDGYKDFGGLMVPTRRTVLPLPFGTRPVPFPTLVSIEVHELTLVTGSSAA